MGVVSHPHHNNVTVHCIYPSAIMCSTTVPCPLYSGDTYYQSFFSHFALYGSPYRMDRRRRAPIPANSRCSDPLPPLFHREVVCQPLPWRVSFSEYTIFFSLLMSDRNPGCSRCDCHRTVSKECDASHCVAFPSAWCVLSPLKPISAVTCRFVSVLSPSFFTCSFSRFWVCKLE